VLYPEGSDHLFIFFLLLLLLDPSSFHLPVFLFYPTVHRHCRCSYTAGIRLPASQPQKERRRRWSLDMDKRTNHPSSRTKRSWRARTVKDSHRNSLSPIGLPPPLARPKDASQKNHPPKHHIFFKKERKVHFCFAVLPSIEYSLSLYVFILRIDSKY
jgi:hypothetical protein